MNLPMLLSAAVGLAGAAGMMMAADPPPFPEDPAAVRERTSFQTSKSWSPQRNLRSDVAMVYGIDSTLPDRVKSWRDRGYRVHLMTGVSWGQYQDYLYGRFDGTNHVDNAQTDRHGKKISHGGDVYYMCPAENFGEFLAVGVQRGLDAGVEAVHLEEPEFWARAGYSEGFKREWQSLDQPLPALSLMGLIELLAGLPIEGLPPLDPVARQGIPHGTHTAGVETLAFG